MFDVSSILVFKTRPGGWKFYRLPLYVKSIVNMATHETIDELWHILLSKELVSDWGS